MECSKEEIRFRARKFDDDRWELMSGHVWVRCGGLHVGCTQAAALACVIFVWTTMAKESEQDRQESRPLNNCSRQKGIAVRRKSANQLTLCLKS